MTYKFAITKENKEFCGVSLLKHVFLHKMGHYHSFNIWDHRQADILPYDYASGLNVIDI